MSIILFSASVLAGIFGCFMEIYSVKLKKAACFLYCVLFLIASVSCLGGNYQASDLGAYLERFEIHDDSYFGWGYARVTDLMRILIGTSRIGYVTTITLLQLLLSYICAVNLDTSRRYIVSYMALFNAYWGISFSIEIIRSGIAIAFSMVAIVLALRNKKILSLVVYALALLSHITEILLLPMLVLFIVKKPKSKTTYLNVFGFLVWAMAILALDTIGFSNFIASFLRGPAMKVFGMFNAQEHYETYLEGRGSGPFSFLTKQYVFYFVLGLVLIYMQRRTETDRKMLVGYFIGLSIRTVFSAFGATTRLQWVYLVLSVFVVFGYVANEKNPKLNRLAALAGLTVLQSIMAMLYLETRL